MPCSKMFAIDCLPAPSKRRFAHAALVAAVLLLGACATQKGVDLPDISDWESRRSVLSEIDEWRFSGRIAVKTQDDGFNARLRWVQHGEDFSATISGPLGIGTVRIEGNNDGVRITDKNGESTVLRDVEAELFYRYGWTIPVQSLRYWVLGIPDPRVPASTGFDDEDRIRWLEQRGWRVDVDRYRAAGGQQMPARLVASSAATTVKMLIDKWVFLGVVDTS